MTYVLLMFIGWAIFLCSDLGRMVLKLYLLIMGAAASTLMIYTIGTSL